ncbi:RNA polymerase-binding protein DksA [Alloalcanivorax xenomutans]|uniref:RNA polymerase-binding protein DksA n=2 Tax=Alloalcanivorax TaxID=3020832 RepID=UPI003BA9A61B
MATGKKAKKKAIAKSKAGAARTSAAGKKAAVKKAAAVKKKAVAKKAAPKKAAAQAAAKKVTTTKKAVSKRPASAKTTAKAAPSGSGKSKAASKKTAVSKTAKTTTKATATKAKPKTQAARKSTPGPASSTRSKQVKSTPKSKSSATTTSQSKASGTAKRAAKAKPAPAQAPARNTTTSSGTARKAPGSQERRPPRSSSSVQVKSTVKKPATAADKADNLIHGVTPYVAKEGEEYMNDAQRAHFRQVLLAWRQELMEEADRTMHHLQDEVANLPDPADRATQEEEFALELRTRDRERKLLKKIEKALDQIDKDDYGYCEACGIEIGIRRLEARPTAELCIDCKELAEIKEKQLAG